MRHGGWDVLSERQRLREGGGGGHARAIAEQAQRRLRQEQVVGLVGGAAGVGHDGSGGGGGGGGGGCRRLRPARCPFSNQSAMSAAAADSAAWREAVRTFKKAREPQMPSNSPDQQHRCCACTVLQMYVSMELESSEYSSIAERASSSVAAAAGQSARSSGQAGSMGRPEMRSSAGAWLCSVCV